MTIITEGAINRLDGTDNAIAHGTQQSNIADVAITYTTGDPSITPNSAITIADGGTPTVDELLEFCVELNAKVSTIIDALEAYGITATS